MENAQKIKMSVQLDQRQKLNEKLERAELQRNSRQSNVKLKAKDESQKVREVNFIQGLEQVSSKTSLLTIIQYCDVLL